MLLTWLYIVCTLIRHVLLIRNGHTELLIRSGYAAILFVTSIGPAVAKATWRHCLSQFIDRVAARTCCAVNVLMSRISFLVTLMDGSVVKHNMLKDKLMFTLCTKCFDEKCNKCTHNDEERSLLGTWTIDEVSKAVEKGYKIMEVYEVWNFKEKRSMLKILWKLN